MVAPLDKKLHKALSTSTLEIQDYIGTYEEDKNYTIKLNTILLAIVSTSIQIADTQQPGISSYLWSELEQAAKSEGLTVVEDKLREINHYSISEIEPEDIASGMNYLGQKMATALYKHIHDLPTQQRKPEMFLRAVEAMLTNLLKQKFADNDPHKVLDSLCEHVHMGLDDSTITKPVKPTAKITKLNPEKPKPVNNDLEKRIAALDGKASKILASGGPEALVRSLPELIPDLEPIIRNKDKTNLDALCQKYAGFFQIMKILENLAHGIKSGDIQVP